MVGQKEPEITPGIPKRTIASIYNPDLLPKEQLIRTFVVRVKKFEKLFADIKSSKMEHPEQPILIVGLRGMGKTTLLLRLAYEVENDSELNTWLLPIVFNEEEYGITRLFKFWETVAQYLEHKAAVFAGLYDQMDQAYELEPNPVKYEKTAFELLLQALRKHEKKLLLFIDNFGDMFQRFNKQEKQRLREVLTTCPDLRIIAGSSVAAESFFKYGDPFYELFKIEQLGGLNRKETETFLLHLGEHYHQNPVKEILEKQPGRIETLRRLTGGIPRTIVLLFEIFVDDKNGDAFTDLERILDSVTPLYKHRMDDLKPQQQEIINALAHSWDAVSAKEVAQKTRLSSKLVSAQLKQLKQNNLVDIQQTNTKNHLYLLHDRFFNIWYLMRMARRGDKKRVLWLVRFLEQWCDEEQLTKRAKSLLTALNQGAYHTKGAFYFSTALYYAEKHDLDTRYKLSKQSQRYFKDKDFVLHEEASRSDMAFFGKAIDALKRRDVEGARQELLVIKDKDAQDYLLLSAICRHLGDFDQADAYYEKALKLKIEHPERVMGDIFCDYLRDYETAEGYYREAIRKGDIKGIRRLATMYNRKLKKQEEAERLYREAIEKGDTLSWSYLADLYRDDKRDYSKAEEYYRKAAEEGHIKALRLLGWTYESKLRDFSKAEELYFQAIKGGETLAWDFLADLHRDEKKDFIKAEEYYKKAAAEGHIEALHSLGWMYVNKLHDNNKAQEIYQEAIEKGDTESLVYMGELYRDEKKDFIKAEEYYRKAASEGHAEALRYLGWMYQDKLKDLKKAEVLYREAIEGGDTLSWRFLADLYQDEKEDYPRAEEYYRKAAQEGHVDALRQLGWMCRKKLKDQEKAEVLYREAIEKGDTESWVNLGELYRDDKQDYVKAEEFYRKAASEGHAEALRYLGWMYEDKLKDHLKAEEFYEKAIEKGDVESFRFLADLYRDKEDFEKAEEYYKIAADKGYEEALRLLGWMYEDKLKDLEKAEMLYREAIEGGDTLSWSFLADLYRDEREDYVKAEEYYRKATEEGHIEALRPLGWLYESKLDDNTEAEKIYHEAIEKGDEKAWNNLGDLYGQRLKQHSKAKEFYLNYKEHDQAGGANSLAELYSEQLDDYITAEKYYLEAIEAGDESAANSIAWMLFKRHLKPQEALKHAEKAHESIQENYVAHTLACILLWNGQAERAKALGLTFLYAEEYLLEDDDQFQFHLLLLAKEEYPFLYDYFTGKKGREFQLKDRFKPLWYALMFYLQDEYPTEYLRMPPEIKETVEEVVARVERMRMDYAIGE